MEAIIYQNTIVKVGAGHTLKPVDNNGVTSYDIRVKDGDVDLVCRIPNGIYVKDCTLSIVPAGFAELTFE